MKNFKQGAKPNTQPAQRVPDKTQGSVQPIGVIDKIVENEISGAKNNIAYATKHPIKAVVNFGDYIANAFNPIESFKSGSQSINNILHGQNPALNAVELGLNLADFTGLKSLTQPAKTALKSVGKNLLTNANSTLANNAAKELAPEIMQLSMKNDEDFLRTFFKSNNLEGALRKSLNDKTPDVASPVSQETNALRNMFAGFKKENAFEPPPIPNMRFKKEQKQDFNLLLDGILEKTQKDGKMLNSLDYYNAKYADFGGLQGFLDKRAANNMGGEIDPKVLSDLNVRSSYLEPYNPGQSALQDKKVQIRQNEAMNEINGTKALGIYHSPRGGNPPTIDLIPSNKNIKQTLVHEMEHANQPNAYKVKTDDPVEKFLQYLHSENETEARAVETLHQAMQEGVSPVYNEATKKAFLDWHNKKMQGPTTDLKNIAKPGVMEYLIDKIVSNKQPNSKDMA